MRTIDVRLVAAWASSGIVLGLGPSVDSGLLMDGVLLAGGALVMAGIVEVALARRDGELAPTAGNSSARRD